jgi:hypothetical protein
MVKIVVIYSANMVIIFFETSLSCNIIESKFNPMIISSPN